jgi:phosphatidate cytidylyltransferase
MLKTRIITAVVLLAVLLPVLYFNNFTAFAVVATVFFGAAIWECVRLFNPGTAPPTSSPWSGPRLFACC